MIVHQHQWWTYISVEAAGSGCNVAVAASVVISAAVFGEGGLVGGPGRRSYTAGGSLSGGCGGGCLGGSLCGGSCGLRSSPGGSSKTLAVVRVRVGAGVATDAGSATGPALTTALTVRRHSRGIC